MKILLFFVVTLFATFASGQDYYYSFENYTLPIDSFDNGSSGTKSFEDQGMACPVLWDTAWGGFWAGGWALSNQTDSTRQGTDGLYQSITGSAHDGDNYLVGQNGSQIKCPGAHIEYTLGYIYITNTSYTYYSMRDGDAFAKKFGGADGNDPDYLILNITGRKQGSWFKDTIQFPLADFRFADNSKDYIVSEWQRVDLMQLSPVDTLHFFLTSSDTGQFGINTPLFFAIDDAYGNFNDGLFDIARPSIKLYPNPAQNSLHLGEERNWTILNMQGQTLLKGSGEMADIRSLIPGTYIIRDENGATARFVKQ